MQEKCVLNLLVVHLLKIFVTEKQVSVGGALRHLESPLSLKAKF